MSDNRNWTCQEDKQLEELVKSFGEKRWKILAGTLNKINLEKRRTGKMCKERWINLKSTSESRNNWDLVEEFLFFEAHSIMGNKWSSITKFLPDKTDNNLKNHFYSNLRKILRKIPKNRFNYIDFKEKFKAFYILKYIIKTKKYRDSQISDLKSFPLNDSFMGENAYIFKLIKKHHITDKHLNSHLEKLCELILKDKYLKERSSEQIQNYSLESTEKILKSVIYYDLILKTVHFYKNNKDNLNKVKTNKISQFIHTHCSKITFNISKSNLNEDFINNFKLFFQSENKDETLISEKEKFSTTPGTLNLSTSDVYYLNYNNYNRNNEFTTYDILSGKNQNNCTNGINPNLFNNLMQQNMMYQLNQSQNIYNNYNNYYNNNLMTNNLMTYGNLIRNKFI